MSNGCNQSRLWQTGVYGFLGLLMAPTVALAESNFLFFDLEEGQSELIYGGLLIGAILGVVLQRSRLCMVAAVSNWVLIRDYRQLHGYFTALIVAMLGVLILEAGSWADISANFYRRTAFDWLGISLGGLVFGFGTMIAGGCAARTLVRTAEGNLGAVIVLGAFVLSGMVASYGLLAPLRAWLIEHSALSGLGDLGLSSLTGTPLWLPVLLFVIGYGIFILRTGNLRDSRGLIIAGLLTGGLVIIGWWYTGYHLYDEFDPAAPVSIAIAGPLARMGLLISSPLTPEFNFTCLALVGIFVGALASSLLSRQFHWVPPQSREVGGYLFGGLMMGVGATFAGGCNMGNGLTGASTTSINALLALSCMLIGMRLGMVWIERREAA